MPGEKGRSGQPVHPMPCRLHRIVQHTQDLDLIANYRAAGFDVVAERHLNDCGNFSFADVSEETVAGLCREVAEARPEAIAIVCTNMRGAPVVDAMERELGIPIYDTIATVLWKSLCLAGVHPARVTGRGRLFGEEL